MKRLFPFFALILLLGTAAKPTDKDAAAFRRPANEYRPMPFWHLNGTLTRDTIVKQINRAKREAGFGGIAVLPVSGTRPEYLTDAYFERYDDMIETMHRNGMELIIYDDIDFPSGTAGGRLQAQYPRDTRKLLEKDEYVITGPATFTQILPDSTEKLLMATTAMNINTYEMIDLRDHIRDGKVTWEVPPGAWRVMFFCCRYNVRPQVDYMDTTAVRKFIRMNYDEYGKRYGKYMGNTVKRVFYDDIGVQRHGEDLDTRDYRNIREELWQECGAVLPRALLRHRPGNRSGTRGVPYDPFGTDGRGLSAPGGRLVRRS